MTMQIFVKQLILGIKVSATNVKNTTQQKPKQPYQRYLLHHFSHKWNNETSHSNVQTGGQTSPLQLVENFEQAAQ